MKNTAAINTSSSSSSNLSKEPITDFVKSGKPLTYSTEFSSEPGPPTWKNLLDDLASSSAQDVLFRSLVQEPSSLPVVSQTDPVARAQLAIEVQVAARNLALLKEKAKSQHAVFDNTLQTFKDDLDDELDLT